MKKAYLYTYVRIQALLITCSIGMVDATENLNTYHRRPKPPVLFGKIELNLDANLRRPAQPDQRFGNGAGFYQSKRAIALSYF